MVDGASQMPSLKTQSHVVVPSRESCNSIKLQYTVKHSIMIMDEDNDMKLTY